jgi:hypothetical protein
MKKIVCIALSLCAALTACKNGNWEFEDYPYQSVYFAYQYPVRTITLGEDIFDTSLDNAHKCEIIATTGGVYNTDKDVTIGVVVDNGRTQNLRFTAGGDPVTPMPANYYQLASDRIVIPKGKLLGGVQVQLTDAFFADPAALKNTYVIPLRMTSVTNADSMLAGKNFVLYAIKYVNQWHGNYLRRGKDVITGKNGNPSRTVTRHQQYVEKDQVIKLSSQSLTAIQYPVVFQDASGTNINCTLRLTFNNEGNCTVSSATTGVTATGTGKFVKRGEKNSWGNADRDAIYLNYQLDMTQMSVATQDTMVLRDRAVAMETFSPVSQ